MTLSRPVLLRHPAATICIDSPIVATRVTFRACAATCRLSASYELILDSSSSVSAPAVTAYTAVARSPGSSVSPRIEYSCRCLRIVEVGDREDLDDDALDAGPVLHADPNARRLDSPALIWKAIR